VNLLAIETSTDGCSVALQFAGEVREFNAVEPRAHTHILMPAIRDLLGDVAPESLDGIVLGNGPGSFIGMRIGASVAQGLASAAGLPLAPVSSLAAVAAEALRTTDAIKVLVTQDARMGQVYLGRFRRRQSGLPVAEGAEAIVRPGGIELPPGTAVAGAGWNRYPELAAMLERTGLAPPDALYPLARHLIALAEADWRPIDPAELEPAYLRSEVAAVPRKSIESS